MENLPKIAWENVLYNGLLEGISFGLVPLILAFAGTFALAIIFTRHRFHAFLIAGFAVTGCYLGMSIGGSRDSIAGVALPAIITLLSGFVAYYFKGDAEVFNRRLVPGCIVAMVAACSFGQAFYSELRASAEKYKVNVDIFSEYEKSKIRANETFASSVSDRINFYLSCKMAIPGEIEMCKAAFLAQAK